MNQSLSRVIYLDNNATTPPAPGVLGAMAEYIETCYYNPSSPSAGYTGADRPRMAAAKALANLINAEGPETFVFTSGATESNNTIFAALANGKRSGTCIISAVEHPSVFEPAMLLTKRGFEVRVAPVDAQGMLCLDALTASLTKETVLISIIAANNETGVLQDMESICRVVRAKAPTAIVHTDATQAIGKLSIDLQAEWAEVDLLSFSGHKFHGPKGIGGLYVRPGILLSPLILGGGQEGGMRAGTINTPALAGLTRAVEQLAPEQNGPIQDLRDNLEKLLLATISGVIIHSSEAQRLPNTSCFSIPGVVGTELVDALARQGVYVGVGSACSSGSLHPPKTLIAMGVEHDIANAAIRCSLNHQTSLSDIHGVVELISVELLRSRQRVSVDRANFSQ